MKMIEYLKGHPRIIIPTLKILEECENLPESQRKKEFIKRLKSELPKYLKGLSKAKIENLVYAQAIPTCRKLGLIYGINNSPSLSIYGKQLLEEKDENKLLLKLGNVVLKFDKENCRIIDAIKENQKYPGDFVFFEKVIITLNKYGLNANQKLKNKYVINRLSIQGIHADRGTRLTDNLKFYEYVGIIIWKEEKIALNQGKINDIEESSLGIVQDVDINKFFDVLCEEYKTLVKHSNGLFYIPIFKVRSAVCYRLKIGEEVFKDKLLSLPTNFKGKHILLSPPMKGMDKHETIIKNNRPVYFISIYERNDR